MPDYSRDKTVPVSRDVAYAFLSDVRNLPRYFPRMTEAEPQGDDRVEVEAVVSEEGSDQRTERGEARFSADEASHRIIWSSDGDSNYRGELTIDSGGDGDSGESSTLRLTLHTDRDIPGMEAAIDETLEGIAGQLTADA